MSLLDDPNTAPHPGQYTSPSVIKLSKKEYSAGLCSSGSGDGGDCYNTGNTASITCEKHGMSASSGCTTSGSGAASDCSNDGLAAGDYCCAGNAPGLGHC